MFGLSFGPQQLKQQPRYPWVDYAKGIAILLVVYRHMLGGYEDAGIVINDYLTLAQQSVYNFRMPLFFILSGIFVRKSMARRSTQQFVIYKLNTIMYPYLVWVTIQLSVQVLFSQHTNHPKQLSDFIYIVYAPRSLDQFWFLYTIFNITIVYALLHTYAQLKPVGQLVVAAVFYYLSTLAVVQTISLLQDTLQFYLYFALGSFSADALLDDKKRPFFSSPWLLTGLLPLFLLSQWYWVQHQDLRAAQPLLFAAIAIVGSAFTLSVSFVLGKAQVAGFLKIIGKHSLYIYILHVLAIGFTRMVLLSILGITNAAVLLPLSMVAGVMFPIIFYQASLRYGLWFLFSFKKPKAAVRL